jgi:hypothetical protein
MSSLNFESVYGIHEKVHSLSHIIIISYLTPWFLVRKRTIPTERPQPAGEVSANFS